MRNTPPIVALLTDFGLSDHYVGTMKAVMLAINPGLRIVDISHEVAPQDVQQAAYLLWASYKYFPKGSILVGIVDPGVGSPRNILAVRIRHCTFLAPDNGLLDLVISEEAVLQSIVVELEKPGIRSLVLPEISRTFHGRDIYGPLAAQLSMKTPLARLGRNVESRPLPPRFVSRRAPSVPPSILHIDRFGNLVTNIKSDAESLVDRRMRGLIVNRRRVTTWIDDYESAPPNRACLIVGSSGLVEIVVRNGSAARLLNAHKSTLLRTIS
ncbi:MAG TPA: hypothetical protein DCP63_01180 [Bacteroidetes bacterium]|nr:hypothetical protein [Bacteroidota bacterium]